MNGLGELGERLACEYLAENGWKIVCKNYRCRFGEIDIIAENGEYIIFAEVKARKSNSLALPREFVTKQKQAKIIKTALVFMADNNFDLQPRFDVIEIFDYNRSNRLKHIENAFDSEAYDEGY